MLKNKNTPRILVITNQYPSKLNSFISRDILSFAERTNISIATVYPKKVKLFQYLPDAILNLIDSNKLQIVRKSFIYNLLSLLKYFLVRKVFRKECISILLNSCQYGLDSFTKTMYTIVVSAGQYNHFKKDNFDLVISYWGNYSGTAAYLFSILTGNKTQFATYLHAGTDLYRKQVYLLEKLTYASLIVTVCDFNKRFLEGLYKERYKSLENKIVKYHLGVQLTNTTKIVKFSTRENYFISVSSLVPAKGVLYTLRALKILKEQKTGIKFFIVGDGPQMKDLKDFVGKNGLTDDVIFFGLLKNEAAIDLMSRAKCLVHASPEIGDAVPTVIKEAMVLGTPVIGTRIAGIPELLDFGDAGILVNPRKPDEIALGIEGLVMNADFWNIVSARSIKFAKENFDQEKNFAELFSKIKPILYQ